MKRLKKTWLVASTLILALAAFGTVQAQEPVEISYWLWDVAQVPQYEECAANFEAAHPEINVNIEQPGGWFDYWTALQTAMVEGMAGNVRKFILFSVISTFFAGKSRFSKSESGILISEKLPKEARCVSNMRILMIGSSYFRKYRSANRFCWRLRICCGIRKSSNDWIIVTLSSINFV